MSAPYSLMTFLTEMFTWWNGQTVGTRVFTAKKGVRAGEDDFGNVYYEERGGKRRWVIYNGYAEASAIPPGWHGWMHHRVDTPPSKEDYQPRSWQKGHLANRPGTPDAWRPAGAALAGGVRPAATGDYGRLVAGRLERRAVLWRQLTPVQAKNPGAQCHAPISPRNAPLPGMACLCFAAMTRQMCGDSGSGPGRTAGFMMKQGFGTLTAGAGVVLAALSAVQPALADKVGHPVAVFMGLDKITGRILTFDAYIDETVRFGSLQIKPHVCYDRPPTEPAQTDSFVEVTDKQLDGSLRRIFSGWMFAASPGLNGVEHPVYDVWLHSCADTSSVPKPADLTRLRDAQPSAVSGVAKAIGPGFDIPPLQTAQGTLPAAGAAASGKKRHKAGKAQALPDAAAPVDAAPAANGQPED